jgi:YD repeat-containing protein
LIYVFDSRQTDIGAWAIDEHHQYDPKSRVVYRGDGTAFATKMSSTTINAFAGVAQTGSSGLHDGDGAPALAARMDSPRALAVGHDGSLYIGTRRGVRRVAANTSVITTVAGGKDSTRCDPNLIDGPAADMCIFARTIDFARDGSLIIADNPTTTGSVDRIRRLNLESGQINHVAGVLPNAGCVNMGDGGLARDAALCNLTAHASAPDGSIYLLDRGSTANPLALRKISTNGIIDTIGTANWSATEDSAGLAVGPDGSVYIAQPRSVQRILPTGEVTHFAGDLNSGGSSGDGGAAVFARFGTGGPMSLAVGGDGRAFIADSANARIRMVDQRGIIRRIAGSSPGNVSGNGGPPLAAVLGFSTLRAGLAPDGSMFLTAMANHTVRLVRPSITGDFEGEALVPSPDGDQLYRFSKDGRHLDTTLIPSGALVYSFGYDESRRLASVVDAAGLTTTIERDVQGNPTKIIAPSGEETLLDTDVNGYISTFIAPNGEENELIYDTGGLLTGRTDPNGVEHDYDYDADGRLVTP